MTLAFRIVLLAALSGVTGCFQTAPGTVSELTTLPPATLGRTVHAAQSLIIEYDGQSWSMQGALEATPAEIRLVGLSPLGQRVITLRWDGTTLTEERDARLPERIRGERILGDVQLIYWPRDALAAALPPGWRVEEANGQRTVLRDGAPFATIRCDDGDPWQGRCVFNQQRYGYRLIIDSIIE